MKKIISKGLVFAIGMSASMLSFASDFSNDYLPLSIKIDRSGKPHLFDEYDNYIDSSVISVNVAKLLGRFDGECNNSQDSDVIVASLIDADDGEGFQSAVKAKNMAGSSSIATGSCEVMVKTKFGYKKVVFTDETLCSQILP